MFIGSYVDLGENIEILTRNTWYSVSNSHGKVSFENFQHIPVVFAAVFASAHCCTCYISLLTNWVEKYHRRNPNIIGRDQIVGQLTLSTRFAFCS